MMRLSIMVALLAVSGSAAVGQHAPPAAANCARAASGAERLICGDTRLIESDNNLTGVYRRLLAHSTPAAQVTIRAEQRAWLAKRDACGDAACLRDRYDARTSALYAQVNARDRLLRRGVSQVGQCAVTRIDQIGPRLGDANDTTSRPDVSGTSVSFVNGVHQVSYELEQGVVRSRLGDPARVCLVSIPKHCPPGDDRGRWYAVTNLRTGARWKMPDAQHMCGGA